MTAKKKPVTKKPQEEHPEVKKPKVKAVKWSAVATTGQGVSPGTLIRSSIRDTIMHTMAQMPPQTELVVAYLSSPSRAACYAAQLNRTDLNAHDVNPVTRKPVKVPLEAIAGMGGEVRIRRVD